MATISKLHKASAVFVANKLSKIILQCIGIYNSNFAHIWNFYNLLQDFPFENRTMTFFPIPLIILQILCQSFSEQNSAKTLEISNPILSKTKAKLALIRSKIEVINDIFSNKTNYNYSKKEIIAMKNDSIYTIYLVL